MYPQFSTQDQAPPVDPIAKAAPPHPRPSVHATASIIYVYIHTYIYVCTKHLCVLPVGQHVQTLSIYASKAVYIKEEAIAWDGCNDQEKVHNISFYLFIIIIIILLKDNYLSFFKKYNI